MIVLQTDRLILRHITHSDLDDLYRMNSDAEIMKYIGVGLTRNYEQMLNEVNTLIGHYSKKPGFGIMATILKDTDTFVGACGLVYYDNIREVEIGYRFLKEHWNKGYATEASLSLLCYGFEALKLKKIYSSAHVENKASQRVIEKIGMTFVENRFQFGSMQSYYVIKYNDYKKQKALLKQLP